MKTIDAIIIHCSATRAGQDLRAKDIDRMHRARGFNQDRKSTRLNSSHIL